MVVGLDKAIDEIVNNAQNLLGNNTVVVVSSDNGGSTWFGGMNEPFRSGKQTPFEGGVRVPAFAIDLSNDGKYLGLEGREFEKLFHISDWFPTFIGWAGNTHSLKDVKLDGLDQSKVLIILHLKILFERLPRVDWG